MNDPAGTEPANAVDLARAAWNAALASQQAIITDAANQIDDMQAQLADAKAEIDRVCNLATFQAAELGRRGRKDAEIDRLYKEIDGYIELYVESNSRRERAEVVVKAAREFEHWAFELGYAAGDNPLREALATYDRLTTSEDKADD